MEQPSQSPRGPAFVRSIVYKTGAVCRSPMAVNSSCECSQFYFQRVSSPVVGYSGSVQPSVELHLPRRDGWPSQTSVYHLPPSTQFGSVQPRVSVIASDTADAVAQRPSVAYDLLWRRLLNLRPLRRYCPSLLSTVVSMPTSFTPLHNLKCMLFNVRSVCNKLSELSVEIAINNSDITLITETWLYQEDNSSLLINVNDFVVLSKDRKSMAAVYAQNIRASFDTRSVVIGEK